MNVRPKNIVVIGGATGIGLATVKLLLQNNVEHVIIASRNPSKLHNVQKEINDERVLVEAFDISLVGKHNEFIEKINSRINTYVDGVIISSGLNFDGGNC